MDITNNAILSNPGEQAVPNINQYKNLMALVDIGQVINSTLELNEVLRIVMDTIVRLTGAERGFLMLRDEQGQLVTRIARNWEQETIDASELSISRTVIDRVLMRVCQYSQRMLKKIRVYEARRVSSHIIYARFFVFHSRLRMILLV